MCSPDHSAAVSSIGHVIPSPQALAALGPVLCLHRESEGVLTGLLRARACCYRAHVDSDCLRECLRFRDAAGDECWRLYALPDTDYLGWERLVADLPACREDPGDAGLGERLWRELAETLAGRRWRAETIRLHAIVAAGHARPAMSEPRVSRPGMLQMRRIARAAGAAMALDRREPGMRLPGCGGFAEANPHASRRIATDPSRMT